MDICSTDMDICPSDMDICSTDMDIMDISLARSANGWVQGDVAPPGEALIGGGVGGVAPPTISSELCMIIY